MAGSFLHILLAQKVRDATLPAAGITVSRETAAAFLAGSVGPDLGFFPGGPKRLSERMHREGVGDFLRLLLQRGQNEVEMAFVFGWALHLYTDLVVHPWVDERVAEIWNAAEGRPEGYSDLWHMRVEWGVDCRLLERKELGFLWELDLRFPPPGDGVRLLVRAGRELYGEDALDGVVFRGEQAVVKWMRRLPLLLLRTGKIRPQREGGPPLSTRLLDGLTRKFLGEWLADVRCLKTASVLAKPWKPDAATMNRVEELGDEVLIAFDKGREERFATFANRSLG